MRSEAALPALRSRVGNDGLDTACERFERRLSEEVGGLRVEMAQVHGSLLRWMFVFWIGQFLATLSSVAMILRAVNLL